MPPASSSGPTNQQLYNQISNLQVDLTSKLLAIQNQITALAAEVQQLGNQGTAAVDALTAEVDKLTP